MLTLALAATAVLAMVIPGPLLLVSMLWTLVARVTDRTLTGFLRRRYEYGPRAGDASMAVLALPWRTLVTLPRAAVGIVLPTALAVSAAFVAGSLVSPSSPQPASWPSLVSAALAWWATAWWGPGSGAVRRGTRGITRRVLAGPRRRRAFLIVLGLLSAAGLLVAWGRSAPDWGPLVNLPWIDQLIDHQLAGSGLPNR